MNLCRSRVLMLSSSGRWPPPRSFDVELAREDFPILSRIVDDGCQLVYLDNAATTQKPRQVIESMSNYYETMNSNVHRAVHTLAGEATLAYEDSRDKVSEWFGVFSGKVLFTGGTTEAINLAAHAWGRAQLKQGDVVVLTEMEHHSDIVPWQMLQQEKDIEIRWVTVDSDTHLLDMEAFEVAMDGAKLVCVIHTSNVLGVRNPVEKIIKV